MGNDDIVARLRDADAWAGLLNGDSTVLEEAATALAERDATIERLTKVAEQAQEDRRTLRYETACLRERARSAERERDEARAEVERLNQDVKAARSETSAVAKVLAFEPPYQASLAKRAEALVHWKEVNGSEIARLQAEVERKDAALRPFAAVAAEYDADYPEDDFPVNEDAWSGVAAISQSFLLKNYRAARAALTAKGGENGDA